MKFSVDDFIHAFLKAAQERDIAALVTYGYMEDGKPTMKQASNSSEEGTKGIMNWLTTADDKSIVAAARALHEFGNRCIVCGGHMGNVDVHRKSWPLMGADDRALHTALVKVILEAAKGNLDRRPVVRIEPS